MTDRRARQESLHGRLEEPIARATALTRRTLAWFPVRVWRHFLRHNGFLLAASISYQSLFSIFAVLYVAFASLGLRVGSSPTAIDRLVALVNRYIPGLIGSDGQGLVSRDQVEAIASNAGGSLAITGVIAGVVAIWTAIGFVTFTRRAVRDIFGLPFDHRNFLLLKARDLLAAVLFGLALIVGALLSTLTIAAFDVVLALVGSSDRSVWTRLLVQLVTYGVAFAINAAALAAMVHFLTGAPLPRQTIWPGALLGGAALAVLQAGVGLLVRYTPSNPLLATFSTIIGFLLWFRLVGIVILVAASWIAVTAGDRAITLDHADR